MEKASTKSALKFVKNTSQSASQWSSTNSREMTKDVLKDKFYDNTKASRKSPPKENTKPQEFKLHTQERAVRRAMFNYAVTTKFYLMELQKKQEERLLKMIEEEEIRLLRKEMVPRAQLMPYFDKPFSPQRSSRTVPKESCLHMMSGKCWSCTYGNEFYNLHHCGHQALKPIK
ncbi:microtubule-destabilizing protein 60 [Gastrolobium bilobum]|uniref:microtubule-destabilizing protein 60 n=1 Tax=Gastrolobium bilobum TaxID=150636 RepID=UPI002AB03423|nr:microtubule-destabilizing protein 60 [Gastrolobium bilobum]